MAYKMCSLQLFPLIRAPRKAFGKRLFISFNELNPDELRVFHLITSLVYQNENLHLCHRIAVLPSRLQCLQLHLRNLWLSTIKRCQMLKKFLSCFLADANEDIQTVIIVTIAKFCSELYVIYP